MFRLLQWPSLLQDVSIRFWSRVHAPQIDARQVLNASFFLLLNR